MMAGAIEGACRHPAADLRVPWPEVDACCTQLRFVLWTQLESGLRLDAIHLEQGLCHKACLRAS